jgi:hypothetical protein
MLVDGQARPSPGELSFEDRREIGAVLRYLAEYHGTGSIAAWFPEGRLAAVDTIANGTGPSEPRQAEDRAALIAAELGVDYVASWTPGEGEGFNFFVEQNGPPLRISGYDYVLRNRSSIGDTVRVEESSVGFAYDEERLAIVMLRDDAELLSLPLAPLIERALDRFRGQASTTALPAELLALEGESDGARLAVFVTAIAGTIDSGETETYRVRTISADYYYSWDLGVAADADSAFSIP